VYARILFSLCITERIALQESIRTNQKFILTTEGRIASYWGEFYKLKYEKDKYVGFKIKKYIQSLRKSLWCNAHKSNILICDSQKKWHKIDSYWKLYLEFIKVHGREWA
jgi:hypothetical protein